eukprot:3565983-Alexandrium_andersonii.AAC.1
MDWHLAHGVNPVLQFAKDALQWQLPSAAAVAASPRVEVAAGAQEAPVEAPVAAESAAAAA